MTVRDSQWVAGQRIEVGSLPDALGALKLRGPVLVVGSARSTVLAPWSDLAESVEVTAGSQPHNPAAVVRDTVALAARREPATIIAVGSASAIDLGKAVCDARGGGLDLVAVPTTLGGSEMSRVYGSRAEDGSKGGGGGRRLLPGTVVYDPALLSTLPAPVLAASGVNALAHAIEAHYAKKDHWLGAAAAVAAATALRDLLPGAATTRDDATHAALFAAACQAGFAMNTCGMGLHHAVCHVLGGLTGVGHAALNTAVLPAAVTINRRIAGAQVDATLAALGIGDLSALVGRITAAHDLPPTLRDLGVTEKQIAAAREPITRAHHLGNNPARPTEADVRDVLDLAYHGVA